MTFKLGETAGLQLADALALPISELIGGANLLYNGATLDMQRANIKATGLASAARTATTATAVLVNNNGRGVMAHLHCTAGSGTGGLTMLLYAVDPVTGTAQGIGLVSAATLVTATGDAVAIWYPGIATSGVKVNQVYSQCNQPVPREFLIQVLHGDGSSYTYSLGYSIIG